MGDFEVHTNGQCFLCKNKIVSYSSSDKGLVNASVHSLRCLSRYLKLDMRKVFDEEGQVSPELLAKVERATLKVELCENCATLNASFSKLERQLEKIEMEMVSHVNIFHRKLLKAEESEIKNEAEFDGRLKIAEALRNETKHKCSHKMIGMSTPRITIQKLSMKQVETQRNKNQGNPNPNEKVKSYQIKTPEAVKEENYNSDLEGHADVGYFDDDYNDDALQEEGQSRSTDPGAATTFIKETTVEHCSTQLPTTTTHTTHQLPQISTYDSDSGTYKCKVCSKTFNQKAGIYRHYRSTHLNIKYKCNLCGEQFSQRCHYQRHHQSVHLGVKFQCLVCSKSYTQKSALVQHQKKGSCNPGRLPKS